mmetsp:Transcript_45614/g.102628  ORF Transcript_45614/g.102628 Transcript_45614/m.102628 type:complete len:219 (-) Transcript_45614:108-764(-)
MRVLCGLVSAHRQQLPHGVCKTVAGSSVKRGPQGVCGRIVDVLVEEASSLEVPGQGLERLVLALAGKLVERGGVADRVPPLDVRALAHKVVDGLGRPSPEERRLAHAVRRVHTGALVQMLGGLVHPVDADHLVQQGLRGQSKLHRHWALPAFPDGAVGRAAPAAAHEATVFQCLLDGLFRLAVAAAGVDPVHAVLPIRHLDIPRVLHQGCQLRRYHGR